MKTRNTKLNSPVKASASTSSTMVTTTNKYPKIKWSYNLPSPKLQFKIEAEETK